MTPYHGDELSVTLFEEAGDALFLFDPDTEQLLDVNPMCQRLSGYARSELLRMQVTYLFRSEIRGGLQRLRHAYKKTGVFHSQEGFLLRHEHEGVWIPVNLTVTRLHAEPKTLGLVTARDVRENREVFAQLKKTEGELRRVLSAVSDCVWSAEIDSSGRWACRYYSPVVEKISGRPPEFYQEASERWLSIVHPEDRPRLESAFARARSQHSGHEEEEYRIVRPDGSLRWVRDSVQVSGGTNGQSLRLDGVVTDITERKGAEAALRASEECFRTLVEKSADAIALLDPAATIRYASPSTARVLGYSPEESVGRNALESVHAEDLPRIRGLFAQCLAEPGKDINTEFRYAHRDGTWRYLECTGNNQLADPGVRAIVVNYRDISARKKAEESLRESEERYRQLVENSYDLICEVNPHKQFVYLSPNYHDVLGYEPGELLGRSALELVHADDVAAVLAAAPKASVPVTYRQRHRNGEWRWFESISKTYQRAKGESRAVVFSRDITERKRAEEELAHERDLLHILMENIPHLIYFKDSASRYTRINEAQVANLGIGGAKEALGKTDFDYYPPELAREFYADEQRIIQTGRPLIDKVERQTGVDATERWLSSTKVPIADKDGQITGIVGVSRDITERKRAEEAVRASEAKYRSLIENLEQFIFLKDSELRFVTANKAFCQSLGRSETEIVGKTDLDFYPKEFAEKYQEDDRRVLTEGKRLELEEQNLSNGQLRTVRVIKTPVKDDQGRIVGVHGIFWDVTEQRALEAQLRQAQKMEAVGQLAGGVAHDFNNLLTIILGNVSLLRAGLPAHAPEGDLLGASERAAMRAAELTSKLLGFSRRTTLRLEPANLNISLDETLALLSRIIDPRISLQVKKAPDLWLVKADPGQMNQVLMNLCLNARDAMPDGGLLHLETENLVLDDRAVRLQLEARTGEFVRLRVRDSGQGIPAEILPRIFEPFFTTKPPGKGTGLGLAMVFGIIKQHQGWIDCSSRVNEGTRFDIYLPRFCPQAETAAPPPVSRSPRPGNETILLVDDEPMIRNLGRRILQSYGYQVLLAEDGMQAVNLYRDERDRIDLVILDLTMPRLSGRDAYRQLLQIDPEVQVLFASGYSAEHITEREYGRILGFVSKPYRPEDLAHTVRMALDKLRNNSGRNHPPPVVPTPERGQES